MADAITGVVHMYIPNDEIFVVRTSLPVSSIFPEIQRIVRSVDPKLAVTQVRTIDEVVSSDMARTRLTMLLLLVASVTALALGIIGVYGILSYSVSQRTRELGLRIALGQRPADVVWMVVVRQGMTLALGGVVGGIAAAFLLTRYLQSLLYEVSATDVGTFAATAAILFIIAVAASYVPARRASRVDPVQALRGD
jgi:ABC-type antimicrobial peptide transport system permease subunit